MRDWFVGNLPFKSGNSGEFSERELVDFFEDRGVHVMDTPRLMRDRHTRDFLGFAFVTVDSEIDPEEPSGPFFGQEMRGRVLRIQIARGPKATGFAGPDPAKRDRARAARQRSSYEPATR